MIEPLSPKGENRWRLDKDLLIREGERAAKGPPRTVNETNTSAKEVTTYEIAGAAGSVVTIKKTYDLKTVAADGAARIQFEGTGDLAFDTQAGLIKTGEFKSGHSQNRTRPFQAGEAFRGEQLNLHAQRFSKQLGDKDHIKVFANTTPTNNSSKRSS